MSELKKSLKLLYPIDQKKASVHDFCKKILEIPLIQFFIEKEKEIWRMYPRGFIYLSGTIPANPWWFTVPENQWGLI